MHDGEETSAGLSQLIDHLRPHYGRKSARAPKHISQNFLNWLRVITCRISRNIEKKFWLTSFANGEFQTTMHEPPKYHILLEDNDLNDRSVAREYDQALLKLSRDGNKELLSANLLNIR